MNDHTRKIARAIELYFADMASRHPNMKSELADAALMAASGFYQDVVGAPETIEALRLRADMIEAPLLHGRRQYLNDLDHRGDRQC